MATDARHASRREPFARRQATDHGQRAICFGNEALATLGEDSAKP